MACQSHADGRIKPWAVYLVVILINFVSAAGVTTLYSMLPTLYRQFGGRHGAGWAVTGYFLVAAISAAFCGRLGDLLGRRFMTLVVLALAAAGALLSALSSSLTLLIAGCALQGTAGALSPLAIGLARESLDARRVPVAIGIIAAAGKHRCRHRLLGGRPGHRSFCGARRLPVEAVFGIGHDDLGARNDSQTATRGRIAARYRSRARGAVCAGDRGVAAGRRPRQRVGLGGSSNSGVPAARCGDLELLDAPPGTTGQAADRCAHLAHAGGGDGLSWRSFFWRSAPSRSGW